MLAVGATAIAGCLGGSGPSGPTVTMTGDLRFDPAEVTIDPGQQVTWVNESGVPHTASAYEEAIPNEASYFASGGYESEQAVRQSTSARGFLERGETYSYTFDVTGTYQYFCLPHEESGMVGRVIVE
ncbi:plastocyanin/azurin family copper-binding protein [Halomicroarcula sp. S1AR25-4]|uniref:plastocyanin/azurin family copper-binding protein n=2 Tax=Halobacteriales TaxID=2235 RepID=UPI002874B76C|nr:plastocyanin/azurin family copper-binding protein [Halomicroarcula sp. S1AR25-4]MDS0280123.1 plastocyanin/azurin family copper-binding protein [Halomicroarcula sp. S1AR25-4]MDS0478192.1 plastocyanin/azurin family copper-binding protein [Natrinema sp. 1APR25-10V2]